LCTPQDLATFSGRDSWDNETAWNYELGGKSTFMGGRASLNLSAFYMDIRDLQMIVTAGSCSSRLVFNTPKAMSAGAEVELTAAPNKYFDFAVSGTPRRGVPRITITSMTVDGDLPVVAG